MKQLLCLVYFFFTASSTMGQDSTIALRRPSRAIIKLSPLSLLDQDATVQAGLEYRVAPMTSIQAEFGYGWKGLSPFQADLEKFDKAELWRLRTEIRFYGGRYRTNRRRSIAIKSKFPLGNYWAIDGLAKQINITRRDYEYQPIYSSSAPRYVGLQTISRYVLGAHLKLGRQFAFYDQLNRRLSRTLLDIYIGAGARWAMNDVRSSSRATADECGCGIGRSFTQTGHQVIPNITAGLKVGFAL